MLACFNVIFFLTKLYIIFQILYIIVGPPLSNTSFSTKPLLPTSTTDLIGQLTIGRIPQARVGNVTFFPQSRASAFKVNIKTVNNVLSFSISSSLKGEQSRVTQWRSSYVYAHKTWLRQLTNVMWPCLSLPLSLTHTHTHTTCYSILRLCLHLETHSISLTRLLQHYCRYWNHAFFLCMHTWAALCKYLHNFWHRHVGSCFNEAF